LIHDAVGKGIGKGNPQFNEIGSCIDEGGDEAGGSGEIGITGYEVGDKGFALLFFETGLEVVDPLGGAHLEKDCAIDRPSFTRENRFRPRQSFGVTHQEGGGGGGLSRPTSRQFPSEW
jgi:hypothetical protein